MGCRRLPRRVSVVLRFDPARVEDLRALLAKGGFRIESRPNALLFAARPGVSLTAYGSGKLLLTGQQESEFALVVSSSGLAEAEERPVVARFEPHAGSDESGKGDFFGPLVVATVHVPDAATARLLVEKGVRDSKEVPDAFVGPLSSLVRLKCPHAVRVLAPPRYNDVYERFGNLNTLLASLHAECIEELLGQVGDVPVVVDQFARPEVLGSRLGPLGRAASVSQSVRAESDVAVAAASILARAEFVAGIAALEARHGARLPKGAGAPVVSAARHLVAHQGRGLLRDVAKTHFATMREALR